MEIKRAMELGDDVREKLGELYVNAFYNDVLKYFSKDKSKLKKVFSYGFLLEYFYVAIIDNEIVGMIACMGKDNICFKNNIKVLVKYLGIFRGLLTYFGLKQFIKEFPKIDENTALLEYLATDIRHLREGIATALIRSLFALPEYKFFLLEVMGTNAKAIKLYTKIGFEVVYKKIYFPVIYIGMKYTKE